jgi:dTDP-glucose 4,6-dehydratase
MTALGMREALDGHLLPASTDVVDEVSMRILISGAAGFLGSHLCDRLLGDGHEVIGLDNFVTGRAENIAHLMGREGFTFYRHDVSNYIFVRGKIDAVLHFASPASPNPQSPSAYFNLPIQTMKAGALGTQHTGRRQGTQPNFLAP